MNSYERLKKNPPTFRHLTGLSVEEFDKLLAELETAWKAQRAKRLRDRSRRRRPGAGRKPKLGLADRLLLVLIYYRTYVTQDFLGSLFGIDKGTACRIIQQIALLLTGIFRIPEKKLRIEPEEIAEVFVDGTEQPINRPKKKQRRSYSGKKKRHTIKHHHRGTQEEKTRPCGTEAKSTPGAMSTLRGHVRQLATLLTTCPRSVGMAPGVASVSKAARGKVHDKKIYDQSKTRIPKEATGYGDTAYQGTPLKTPKKKPRKGDLNARDKKGNRRVSRKRIVVEHGIGKMKIWRIASDRYRNPLRRHTVMMKNVAGLHNRMFG